MTDGLDEYGPPIAGVHTPADRLTERIADAMSRNGLNTLLLDLKEDLAVIGADMRHLVRRNDDFQRDVTGRLDRADQSRRELHNKVNATIAETATLRATIDRIAPMVDAHERENIARAALRSAISKWMGHGKVVYGAIVAVISALAGWLAAHLPNLSGWWPR